MEKRKKKSDGRLLLNTQRSRIVKDLEPKERQEEP